jgi:hypothetical protein
MKRESTGGICKGFFLLKPPAGWGRALQSLDESISKKAYFHADPYPREYP